jgi:hypothetical protein
MTKLTKDNGKKLTIRSGVRAGVLPDGTKINVK